ncbi:hypothetical protein PR048_033623 [Dryococelus australis]|uniref:Uncharacterized protein n=1 Tax=Dryococelus australis TaxID=614101 RepID=A0ABQ9G4X6_9NEOP|nr:hypothetical protein PR048_033623 [Dryococelus australis]
MKGRNDAKDLRSRSGIEAGGRRAVYPLNHRGPSLSNTGLMALTVARLLQLLDVAEKQMGCERNTTLKNFAGCSRSTEHFQIQSALVAERLARSPPTTAKRVQSPAGSLRIFASGNRAGRCRWSAGFLGDIPFPPAPLYRRRTIFTSIALIGSQELTTLPSPRDSHCIPRPYQLSRRWNDGPGRVFVDVIVREARSSITRNLPKRLPRRLRDNRSLRKPEMNKTRRPNQPITPRQHITRRRSSGPVSLITSGKEILGSGCSIHPETNPRAENPRDPLNVVNQKAKWGHVEDRARRSPAHYCRATSCLGDEFQLVCSALKDVRVRSPAPLLYNSSCSLPAAAIAYGLKLSLQWRSIPERVPPPPPPLARRDEVRVLFPPSFAPGRWNGANAHGLLSSKDNDQATATRFPSTTLPPPHRQRQCPRWSPHADARERPRIMEASPPTSSSSVFVPHTTSFRRPRGTCVTERGSEKTQSSVTTNAGSGRHCPRGRCVCVQTTPKVVKGASEDILRDGIDSCDNVGLELFECVQTRPSRLSAPREGIHRRIYLENGVEQVGLFRGYSHDQAGTHRLNARDRFTCSMRRGSILLKTTYARLHHRGSKLDPRSDLKSTQKNVAPFEFRVGLEIERKFISNRRNWRSNWILVRNDLGSGEMSAQPGIRLVYGPCVIVKGHDSEFRPLIFHQDTCKPAKACARKLEGNSITKLLSLLPIKPAPPGTRTAHGALTTVIECENAFNADITDSG